MDAETVGTNAAQALIERVERERSLSIEDFYRALIAAKQEIETRIGRRGHQRTVADIGIRQWPTGNTVFRRQWRRSWWNYDGDRT